MSGGIGSVFGKIFTVKKVLRSGCERTSGSFFIRGLASASAPARSWTEEEGW